MLQSHNPSAIARLPVPSPSEPIPTLNELHAFTRASRRYIPRPKDITGPNSRSTSGGNSNSSSRGSSPGGGSFGAVASIAKQNSEVPGSPESSSATTRSGTEPPLSADKVSNTSAQASPVRANGNEASAYDSQGADEVKEPSRLCIVSRCDFSGRRRFALPKAQARSVTRGLHGAFDAIGVEGEMTYHVPESFHPLPCNSAIVVVAVTVAVVPSLWFKVRSPTDVNDASAPPTWKTEAMITKDEYGNGAEKMVSSDQKASVGIGARNKDVDTALAVSCLEEGED